MAIPIAGDEGVLLGFLKRRRVMAANGSVESV
jgi:hypothetical protein